MENFLSNEEKRNFQEYLISKIKKDVPQYKSKYPILCNMVLAERNITNKTKAREQRKKQQHSQARYIGNTKYYLRKLRNKSHERTAGFYRGQARYCFKKIKNLEDKNHIFIEFKDIVPEVWLCD